MAPDGSKVFNEGAQMVEAVVYEKGKESAPDLTWGHWIVIEHPVKDKKTGNAIECQKHITVNPKNSLSLQIHKGREEIYTGLEGVSKVCVNGEIFDLGKGDKVFLPRGCLHFSWNDTDEKTKFHEIQRGPLCDENDIKRACDRLKAPHLLHNDEEIVQMMIEVCKDRYDAGERAVYEYGSNNPNMQRIADADLINIYMEYKDDPETLWSKMDDVLQQCKKLHTELTPVPEKKPQQRLAAE